MSSSSDNDHNPAVSSTVEEVSKKSSSHPRKKKRSHSSGHRRKERTADVETSSNSVSRPRKRDKKEKERDLLDETHTQSQKERKLGTFSQRMLNVGEKMNTIELSWNNLSYQVPNPAKKRNLLQKCQEPSEEWKSLPDNLTILSDLSGRVKPGTFLGIIGSSGAGKSTLLNILAGRVQDEKLVDAILLNGIPLHSPEAVHLRQSSVYVMQDDVLLPTQTPKEIISFSAQLRLPSSVPNDEREARVNALIEELNIVDCQNTYVGAPGVLRGISGGERKRVCVAQELVTNPSLIFLDEPTSGLDSFTAQNLVQTLKDLTVSGRTIVATLHQPNSQIFQSLDELLVLARGKPVYYGPADQVVSYFKSIGIECPPYMNPCDFVIKMAHVDQSDPESRKNVEKLQDAYQSSELCKKMQVTKVEEKRETTQEKTRGYARNVVTQTKFLIKRALTDIVRSPLKLRAQAGQTIMFSLLLALIWLQVENGQAGARDRLGAIFFLIVNQVFGSVMSKVNTFPSERSIFFRETSNRMYHPLAFYFSRLVSDIVFQVFFPFVFATVSYWGIGLQAQADKYFIFVAIVLLAAQIGDALGFFVGIIAPNPGIAVAMTPLLVVPPMIFSGFFINQQNVPVYFVWLQYLSFIGYSFEALVLNEFTGLTFTCNQDEEIAEGVCPIQTGEQVISSLDMDKMTIGKDVAALLAMIAFFRIVGGLAITWRAKKYRSNA